ncbi:class I SAM-dependent methyltransferase [Pseudomonas vanderleydeniana]|uniref:Class I SAM-dependent methyltransferase n=1 Tax=Pseudomonas vanderleydeniana TaxID=2745495 RepID=A0A9E6PS32_9PSED|nr:methyltransferase [Pseudomonas vanderleydeniana]QXI31563.1 class I SAM-dependent methyltransferase [Pseudomonas vanderleydeniana]
MTYQADQTLVQLGRRLQADGYRFVTPTPLTHQRVLARSPVPCAVDLRDVFGWSMPFDSSLMGAVELSQLQEAGILRQEGGLLRSTIRWSSLGDLLLAHSAYPTQEADAVFFGPDSYRFARAITDYLNQRFEPIERAVDIGCGTGVGALLMARARPDARVLAVDINPRALRLSAVNAELAETRNLSIYHSDLLDSIEGRFDLIVANPPYMNDSRQRAYRHGGGGLGEHLSLRILQAALPRLNVNGALVLYTGAAIVKGRDPFLEAARPLLLDASYGWTYRELDPDVFGEELDQPGYEQVERIAVVVLTVTRLR